MKYDYDNSWRTHLLNWCLLENFILSSIRHGFISTPRTYWKKILQKFFQRSILFQTVVLIQIFNFITCKQQNYLQQSLIQILLWLFNVSNLQRFLIQLYINIYYVLSIGVGSILISVLVKIIIPQCWFQSVEFFRDKLVQSSDMDTSLTSILRRKATARNRRFNYEDHLRIQEIRSAQRML
ncbi:unnamed protein product [Paramecium sonneborni]|uniref:Transmembrane protein n=1 Tax=Paramecium sonneborni TaxID=65129 RepID=A0A8S1RTM8_9CILI|nr:unnamed protein product [Paramecium sonneborni]